MALNPRLRSHVANNSFPQYVGGLLSDAGNQLYSHAQGNVQGLLGDIDAISRLNSQSTPEEAWAANEAMMNYLGAGTIAGRMAKTLNPKTVELAESMKAQGANRDEIWKATGEQYGQPSYFDPVDNSFRWVIPDNEMAIKRSEIPQNQPYLNADEAIEHDKLFQAYPHLREANVSFDAKPNSGSYHVGDQMGYEYIDFPSDRNNLRAVSAHEFNHPIQRHEGFAMGGNPEMFKIKGELKPLIKEQKAAHLKDFGYDDWEFDLLSNKPKEYDRLLEAYADNMEVNPFYDAFAKTLDDNMGEYFTGAARRFDAQIKDYTSPLSPHAQYKRLLGEAEAFAGTKRMNLDLQQNIDRPIWKDYDVPEDEFIRRYDGLLAE